MEYFYGGGGRSNPDFLYRFLVKEVTHDMWEWCESYPLTGPFERWYVVNNSSYVLRPSTQNNDLGDQKEIPMIQFESRKAAYMFRLAYSEYILEDKTYDFARSLDDGF